MMKKIVLYIAGIICIVIVFAPLSATFFVQDQNKILIEKMEKRRQAQWPAIQTWQDLIRSQTYARYSRAIQDRFPFRSYLYFLKNMVDAKIFRQKQFGKVELGKNGWMFIRDSFMHSSEQIIDVKKSFRIHQRFMDMTRNTPAKVRILIGPDKHTIYSEQMNHSAKQEASQHAWYHQGLENYFQMLGDHRCLLFWSLFNQKKLQMQELLFYPTNTHPTPTGLLVMIEALIESLEPGMWKASEIYDLGEAANPGDLSQLAGLTFPDDKYMKKGIFRKGVQLDREIQLSSDKSRLGPEEERWAAPIRYHTKYSPGDVIKGKTLLLHDSIFGEAREYLWPFFAELTCRHYKDFMGENQLAEALQNYDLVMIEIGERGASEIFIDLFSPFVSREVMDLCPEGKSKKISQTVPISQLPPRGVVRYGNTPVFFILTGTYLSPGMDYLLTLKQQADRKTYGVLFAYNLEEKKYTTKIGDVLHVSPGQNTFYIHLTAEQLRYPLFYYPGEPEGDYEIQGAELRGLARWPDVSREPQQVASLDLNDTLVMDLMAEEYFKPGVVKNNRPQIRGRQITGMERTGAGLHFQNDSTDPYFVIDQLSDIKNGRFDLEVEIDSLQESLCQVFYLDEKTQDFNEAMSIRRKLAYGRNRLRFNLPPGAFRQPIRIDPVCYAGGGDIRSLRIVPRTFGIFNRRKDDLQYVFPLQPLWVLSQHEINKLWSNQHLSLKAVEKGIRVQTTSDDGCFYLPAIPIVEKKCWVTIDIYSSQKTVCQLFYRSSQKEAFTEAHSYQQVVAPGWNALAFLVRADAVRAGLRIDPACHAGEYLIRQIKVVRKKVQ